MYSDCFSAVLCAGQKKIYLSFLSRFPKYLYHITNLSITYLYTESQQITYFLKVNRKLKLGNFPSSYCLSISLLPLSALPVHLSLLFFDPVLVKDVFLLQANPFILASHFSSHLLKLLLPRISSFSLPVSACFFPLTFCHRHCFTVSAPKNILPPYFFFLYLSQLLESIGTFRLYHS